MNIAVIGLGSMGRRRIRLIKKIDSSVNIFGVDLKDERRELCEREFGINTTDNLEELLNSRRMDCAFVCTAPLSHSKIINICLKNGLHVFTELNLVSDGYDENIALAQETGRVLFMSSTFLYRDEIIKIKELVNTTEKTDLYYGVKGAESPCGCRAEQCDSAGISPLNYTYHVGQYLPDWHPWECYRDFFVGDARTNGCREIFAIELPWLVDTFGEITDISVTKSKNSSLDIAYNDNYLLLVQHESGHKGALAVDVISRKAVRNLEIFGESLYLHWDGSPTGLYLYDFESKEDVNIKLYDQIDRLDNYSSFVVENAYTNEIESFFAAVKDGAEPLYSFERDKTILDIIDRIEA